MNLRDLSNAGKIALANKLGKEFAEKVGAKFIKASATGAAWVVYPSGYVKVKAVFSPDWGGPALCRGGFFKYGGGLVD